VSSIDGRLSEGGREVLPEVLLREIKVTKKKSDCEGSSLQKESLSLTWPALPMNRSGATAIRLGSRKYGRCVYLLSPREKLSSQIR